MFFAFKDPDSSLDYKFDWKGLTNGHDVSDWLASGETILSAVVTVSGAGLVKDGDSISDSNTSVTVWLSGGNPGETGTVACKITTTDNRIDERTATIKVLER